MSMESAKEFAEKFYVDKEEYEKASADFLKNKGAWNAIKIFMHFNKVIKAAEKEGK